MFKFNDLVEITNWDKFEDSIFSPIRLYDVKEVFGVNGGGKAKVIDIYYNDSLLVGNDNGECVIASRELKWLKVVGKYIEPEPFIIKNENDVKRINDGDVAILSNGFEIVLNVESVDGNRLISYFDLDEMLLPITYTMLRGLKIIPSVDH